MNIEKAGAIDGWMSSEELTWLAEQATQHKVIVELGSYKGRSTRVLGDHTPGIVIAIDDWRGCGEGEETPEELYEQFEANLLDLILTDKVIPKKQDHLSLTAETIPDMVFIDGDHSCSAVTQDIKNWYSVLKEGGLLCGHDSGFEGVRQAIDEMFPKLYTLVKATTIWYVIKPSRN